MVIREMGRAECLRMLAAARRARLACAHENQPYVVPVSLAYDEASACLYGFSPPGQKVEWMRANPQVCIEVDKISADDEWVSVIAIGRYEELPATPRSEGVRLRKQEPPRQADTVMPPRSSASRHCQCDDQRRRAWQILKTNRPVWWEPSCTAWVTRSHGNSAEPLIPVYYKIRIDRVTGRKATRDARDTTSYAGPALQLRDGAALFQRTLSRVLSLRSKP